MRAALVGVALGVLTGCGTLPGLGPRATEGPIPDPPFPECVAEEYAYYGETTMAALGVSRPSGRAPPEANRVGTIWVTADRRHNQGEPAGMAFGRMLCIQFPDSGEEGGISAMTNFPVVDSWQPPGLFGRTATPAPEPRHLVAAGLGVLVLMAVSLLAFRRSR